MHARAGRERAPSGAAALPPRPSPRSAAVPQPPALRCQDGAAGGLLSAPAAPRHRSAAASGGRRLRARLVRGERAAAGPGQRHGAWGRAGGEGRGGEGWAVGAEGAVPELPSGNGSCCPVPRVRSQLCGRALEIRMCERRPAPSFLRDLRGAVGLRLLGLRHTAAPRGPGCTSGPGSCVSASRLGTLGALLGRAACPASRRRGAGTPSAVLRCTDPRGRPDPARLSVTAEGLRPARASGSETWH